jgi:hypothetical protein
LTSERKIQNPDVVFSNLEMQQVPEKNAAVN